MSSRVAEDPSAYGQPSVAEQRVVLHNVSWAMFEKMLGELGDNRACRLTYDGGILEIMSPSKRHETSSRVFDALVLIMVSELKLQIQLVGSMTCKREDLLRGLEPDSSYYVQNEFAVRGKQDLDLSKDPPPDLMIEVDISRSSMNKMPICAALGVSEFWRYDGSSLRIYILNDSTYTPVANSPTFRNLPLAEAIPGFIDASTRDGLAKMLEDFRAWVKQQLEARK